MSKPFAGVRILDFTRYLAGPYGTYQLALLGADVVKIESQEGDETRGQLADKKWAERKMAPSFLAVNGNKRSITLDLRKPEAVEIVKRLVVGADVVWENFRGGVMDRLGLGYEVLSAINPRLIYCGVSGFGRTGPEKTTAAFDGKLQAMSGIMSITGEPAHGPTRAGFAICDTIGGVTAALAVASALFQRTHTGRGQLRGRRRATLDAALAFIPGPCSEYTVAGIEQRQIGNPLGEPQGDGQSLPDARRLPRARGAHREAVGEPHEGLGVPDALADPRFVDWPARTANEPALREIIDTALSTDDARSWEARLTEADGPCGSSGRSTRSSTTRSSSTATCHADHRLALWADEARRRGIPPRARQPGIDREPPTLGEHTGRDPEGGRLWRYEIERLRRDAVDLSHAAHAHLARCWASSTRSCWAGSETPPRPKLVAAVSTAGGLGVLGATRQISGRAGPRCRGDPRCDHSALRAQPVLLFMERPGQYKALLAARPRVVSTAWAALEQDLGGYVARDHAVGARRCR